MSTAFLAAAYGGGRNGAYLIGMYERGIKPDIITFANTGREDRTHGEKPETYAAVDRFSRWCEEKFGIPVTLVRKQSMYQSLYDNCLEKKMLPSAAYGLRSCSDKWKIQPQARFMNGHPPAKAVWKAGGKVTKAIGYDAGEVHRAKISDDAKYTYWYPLIEWGWFLEDCVDAFARHGLTAPPKSACYFCPSSKKEEVIWLAENHPDLYAEAVAMEDAAIASGTLRTVKGLGRHWTWRDLVQIQPAQREQLPEAPAMACACFDSED